MNAPRNEHEALTIYQELGTDGIYGASPEIKKNLAGVLSIEVTRMDPRHPATAIVKRDIGRLYEQMHPEVQPAPEYQRSEARQTINQLKTHPAYSDAKHPEHANVVARITRAYEVEKRGVDA